VRASIRCPRAQRPLPRGPRPLAESLANLAWHSRCDSPAHDETTSVPRPRRVRARLSLCLVERARAVRAARARRRRRREPSGRRGLDRQRLATDTHNQLACANTATTAVASAGDLHPAAPRSPARGHCSARARRARGARRAVADPAARVRVHPRDDRPVQRRRDLHQPQRERDHGRGQPCVFAGARRSVPELSDPAEPRGIDDQRARTGTRTDRARLHSLRSVHADDRGVSSRARRRSAARPRREASVLSRAKLGHLLAHQPLQRQPGEHRGRAQRVGARTGDREQPRRARATRPTCGAGSRW